MGQFKAQISGNRRYFKYLHTEAEHCSPKKQFMT